MTEFYIADLRKEWSRQPYITFWRPDNANYAWPLVWAGKYGKAIVDAKADYYCVKDGRIFRRFPVPCAIVEALGVQPEAGRIDGNTGPVVLNTKANREKLRKAMYRPAGYRTFSTDLRSEDLRSADLRKAA